MRHIIIISGLIFNLIFSGAIWAKSVVVSVRGVLPSPPQFALGELQSTLSAKGIDFHVDYGNQKADPVQFIIQINTSPNEIEQQWDKAESFGIVVDNNQVTVNGSDPVGLMYGIYELGEQRNCLRISPKTCLRIQHGSYTYKTEKGQKSASANGHAGWAQLDVQFKSRHL